MKLVIATLWARRVGDEYDDAPELLEAWTEWQVEGWPEGWDEAKQDAIRSLGDQYRDSREFDITVDYDQVQAHFGTGDLWGVVAAPMNQEDRP